jgi:hypothetical protein
MKNPLIKTARGLSGLRIADLEVSIRKIGEEPNGKPRWEYFLDRDGKPFHHGTDLAGWGSTAGTLLSLLHFLSAAGESTNYERRTGQQGDHSDLFPKEVSEWADTYDSELHLAVLDLDLYVDWLENR